MANYKKIIHNQILLSFIIYFIFAFIGCEVPKKKPFKPIIKPTLESKKEPEEEQKILTKKTILIGIFENYPKVTIYSDSKFTIKELNNSNNTELKSNGTHIVSVSQNKILINNKKYSSPLKLIPENSKQYLRVENKRYRGIIILRLNSRKRITVINEIGLEEYICGIMTKEVSPDWPIESLKAQAIVARTFALKSLSKHSKDGFNLCSKTHCQVYGGVDSEDERSNKAVYDTAGEVLMYDGQIISSFYHSSCGGCTEDVKNVWNSPQGKNPEFLTGVKCGFCEEDRWYNWNAALSFKMLYSNISNAGYRIGEIKRIKTVGNTSSDRVIDILIEHTKGKLWLTSHKFRMIINPNTVRSTNFKIKVKNKTAYLTGHGWGHGVGMCQWGARGMAFKGRNYKEILKYYYKGTKIEQLKD